MSYARGGGGAGGGGGGRQANFHLPLLFGKHDRYCVWCGGIISRQVQQKTVTCPHEGCKRDVPLRQGTWIQKNVTGMSRCPQCDSFVHKSFLYCQMCRNGNEEGIRKRKEADGRALAEEREANKRLKLELAKLKAERAQERQMEVDFAAAAALVESAVINQRARNETVSGFEASDGAQPLAGNNEDALLDQDDDEDL